MTNYQKECEEFALFSSPFQEHCQDSNSDDYHSELWASEAESMRINGEIEMETYEIEQMEAEKIYNIEHAKGFIGPIQYQPWYQS